MSSKVGRPTKITATVVSKLEEAFQHGATVAEACYYSGISRETFYSHYNANLVFSDKMDRSRSWLLMKAKHNIASAILAGDLKSSAWLLEKAISPTIPIKDEIPEPTAIDGMP